MNIVVIFAHVIYCLRTAQAKLKHKKWPLENTNYQLDWAERKHFSFTFIGAPCAPFFVAFFSANEKYDFSYDRNQFVFLCVPNATPEPFIFS